MSLNFTIPEIQIGGAGTPPLQFFKRGFNLQGGGSGPSWQDIILSGNGSLTLTKAKANGLSYLKLFGGTEQRNLPKGYTQYEYLRSTGTQYIDLGYKGNGNTKVKIKFRYHTSTSATGSGRVFGSRITSSSDAFAIGSASGIVSAEGTNKVFWCYDGQPYYVDDTTFGLDEWKTVVFSATEHTIDGVTVGDDYTLTEFETPFNLKLFGFDNNGTMGVGYVDIAFCKLWVDGVLVRDVVPAGDGTTNSMYDKVSGTMLPNAGTGTFEVGNTVVPTPDEPINIVSNNGVLKFGKPITIDNTRNYAYINATGSWAWSSDSYSIALPVTVGEKYRIIISSTDSSIVGTIFRYGFTDSDPEEFKQSEVTPSPTSISIYDFWRGTPQDLSDVEVTATHPYMIIQFAAAYASTVVSTYLTVIDQSIYTDGTTETVEVTGKNLFDINSVTILGVRYTSTAVGNNIEAVAGSSTNTSSRISIFIPVSFFKENTTYYFNSKSDTGFNLNRCTIGKSTPDSTSDSYYYGTINQKVDNGYSGSFTITDIAPDQEYVSIFYYLGEQDTNTKITISNIQIELGSTATTYEPYFNGGQATAEMLLKVGDYQDVQSVLNGNVTRNVGIKVLDGTESFTVVNNTFRYNLTGLKMNTKMICSHFDGDVSPSTTTSNQPDLTIKSNQSNNNNAYIKYTAKTTVEDFQQWLTDQYNAGTPVIVIYPLVTPTTESVESQALTIQAGTNIVEITQASINNLGLEVSYKGTV